MGYYSKVAIAMEKEESKKLIEAYKNEFPDDDMFNVESLSALVWGKKFTVFYWEEIKWYIGDYGYTETNWVMDYLENLRESPNPYLFIKVGEELGDIEEIYNEAEGDTWEIHRGVMAPYYGIDSFCEFNNIEW